MKTKPPFKKIAGYTLLGLGIIGLFTPFLQGILLIAAGLGLIENKKLDAFFEKIKKKYGLTLKKKKKKTEDRPEEQDA